MRKILWVLGIVVFLTGGSHLKAEEAPLPSQKWLQFKELLTKDTSLVRLYTFEAVENMKVKNLAGNDGDAEFIDLKAPKGEPFAEALNVVNGRWEEKKAVRIDQCSFRDKRYKSGGQPFSVECVVRVFDYGKIQLPAYKSGTIVTVGSGYYGGWRILVSYPSKELSFQMGSTLSEGGTRVRGGTIASDIWHHIVITYDGKNILLYHNGKLAGQSEHPYPYVDEGVLIIGYSGYGTGSLDMIVDMVAIYSRVLTKEEIAQHFEFLK